MIAAKMSIDAAAESWWRQRSWSLAVALLLLVTGPSVWAWLRPTHLSLLFWLCWVSAAFGLGVLLAALVLKAGKRLATLQLFSGNLLILGLLLGVIEAGGRAAGVDFNTWGKGPADPRADYPLCFREPDEPLGEVYFKRPADVEWSGRPLSKILEIRHGNDMAYRDEAAFTLRYDGQGFRNPSDLKDWDAVVVGDSFTETGYLPAEKVFTSVAAAQSGQRVKNLGICNTGPFTHIAYFQQFGTAPACGVAVLAFFEGNDITDAEQEAADLESLRAGGKRPLRQAGPQTSFVKAIYQRAKSLVHISQNRWYRNAVFTAGGKERPITLQPLPMPPDPAAMTEKRKELIGRFLDEWRAVVEKAGMKPWVLYLPINNRTYHGLYRGQDNLPEELKTWQPNNLPEFMRSQCEQRDFHFLDATPVLRTAAEKGTLVYNPIFDTHLNEEGSRLVGELLARALKDAMPAPAPPP